MVPDPGAPPPSILYRPGRFTRDVVCASALVVLAAAGLVRAGLRGAAPGAPSAPEPAGFAETRSGAPRPVPAGVAARVVGASTLYDVDAQPELLNREGAERALTRWLFDREVKATRSAVVAVWVEADGTVGREWVDARDPAQRPLAAIALPALAEMRFRPLTRDGAPIPAVVWIEMELVR